MSAKITTHILVIRLSAMGDVAMTVPVIRALTEQYPNVKLTILTRAFFTPFFRDLENVTVFPADVKGKHKGILGLFKLAKQLKALKIDAVADLHNVLRSNILKTFLIGIKTIQIDKGRAEKKALVSGKEFKQLKTTHQRYADVFKALGFPIDLSNPIFPKKKPLSEKVIEIIGNTPKKRIGIAPFAAHESKMYPLEQMEQVIEKLSQKYQVLLFGGGKKEIQTLTYFESQKKGIINLAGKLTLGEEFEVVSNLDVMLSMDSGNAHMAAMLGVKVITVWGVTHPYAGFASFNQPDDYALLANRTQYPKIPTSVYGNVFPENYKNAAGSIAPQTIINKIESIL
ncbi:MAG: glycosyltransferase family 9 protein [Xanthomarina gelatinilytica]|uniref:glycosyltransferase family 9 protein n=1 Tax=Xanthomarina gelatinilytica TaxID=1137281 RepID=UPI003A862961